MVKFASYFSQVPRVPRVPRENEAGLIFGGFHLRRSSPSLADPSKEPARGAQEQHSRENADDRSDGCHQPPSGHVRIALCHQPGSSCSAFLGRVAIPKPHAGAPAVLGDELNTEEHPIGSERAIDEQSGDAADQDHNDHEQAPRDHSLTDFLQTVLSTGLFMPLHACP